MGWIGGFVTWTLGERGPGAIYFIFQDDLGCNDIHFFICPKLMSKFLKWVAKFAIRRCTSYTDSQESVYLIAQKKKKTQFIKFTNNCIVGILLNSLHLFLLLSLLLLIFQFFQVASWPCFWKESNIGLCTQ